MANPTDNQKPLESAIERLKREREQLEQEQARLKAQNSVRRKGSTRPEGKT